MNDRTHVVIRRTRPTGDGVPTTTLDPSDPANCASPTEEDSDQGEDQTLRDGVSEEDDEDAEAFPALRILTKALAVIGVLVLIILVRWLIGLFTN